MILDLNKFLKNAVIVACITMVTAQAILPAYASDAPHQASVAMQVINKSSSDKVFKAKSLSGDEVHFLDAHSGAFAEKHPDFNEKPQASFQKTDDGSVICAVSDNPGVVQSLGGKLVQIDSLQTGAIVEGGLTRLTTSAHEYSHCLDILANKQISQEAHRLGVTPYAIPSMTINKALMEGNNDLDFNWITKESPASVHAIMESSSPYLSVSMSLLESYADLHGALQTASTTGDLRGFTEFELSIRMNDMGAIDHATALSVARALKHEQEQGFDASTLRGKSHEEITTIANDIFLRNFSENGTLSVNSPGFINIVKEIKIREMLGVRITEDVSSGVEALLTASGSTVNDQDKADYVQLMQTNHAHQTMLSTKANQETLSASNIPAMLNKLESGISTAKITLNVQSDGNLGSIFSRTDVDKNTVLDAALSFFNQAIKVKETGIQSTPGSIANFIKNDREIAPSL